MTAPAPCIFCTRPLALGDPIACGHHRAVLSSLITPEQAQWQRDNPESTWRPNTADPAR